MPKSQDSYATNALRAAPIPLAMCVSSEQLLQSSKASPDLEGAPLLVREESQPVVGILVVPLDEKQPSPSCIGFDGCIGPVGWAYEKTASLTATGAMKILILVAVMLQNTAYALLRAYSRGTLKETWSTSSALLAMELAKLVLSSWQLHVSDAPTDVPRHLSMAGKWLHLLNLRSSAKMAVPALIYLIMNILSFYALGRIDAATFAIVSQLKVLTTAVCSVAVLGRSLTARKWRALFTLTLGVVLITAETHPGGGGGSSYGSGAGRLAWLLGLLAVVVEVVLSGFASIYFEKVLKSADETYSVWDRNFQLASWSILVYAPLTLHENPASPFAGWSWMAAACAAAGALGGVLVALSLKYADSVTKTIATTGSIVLTTLLNAGCLDGPFTLAIVVATLQVITSVFSFGDNGESRSS